MSEVAENQGADHSLLDTGGDHDAMDNLRPLPRISIQAFCESDSLMQTISAMADDRRLARVHMRTITGGLEKACTMYASSPTPNLIILENALSGDELLNQLAELADVCDPTTKVIIIGYDNDVFLYRELIRRGISEYLVGPVSIADIIHVVSTIFVDPEAEPLGRTIAFVGAKGGVGASTVAHNCAWGISSLFETEVILADLDLAFGTANINFDQDPPQGIAEAVFAPERLDDVFLERLLSKCASHLSMLAAPSMLDRTYDFSGSTFEPVLEIVQRTAPVAVLDVPHMWTNWTKSVLAEVDDVVVVATPDLPNLRNTKNLIDTLGKLRPNDRTPRLVLNQVGVPKRPEISVADFCEPLEIDATAIIPFDAQLFGTASNSGQMIAETDAKAPIAETFSQLAHVLTGRAEVKAQKKSGLTGLRSLLARK
ncbi:AAA family ATPase [Hoeflea poritis]|uniref:AAA family ATPase n=1 Tax=Hoeflea poritis TaxID=2993659 RepID=A0ABT4VTA0_9HYPH|nr:AAA family ATPase [Hoeflea poritis]MDA4847941.1 AAA family ATPase [Hoeflea poritis]